MKLGARIIKTGLAIMLALFLTPMLGLDSPAFAGIAATFAVQPSIYRTYQTIVEQVQANVIGAFFAITFAYAFGVDPFIIGLTAIVVIAVNLRLKLESMIPIALVTVIAIMENTNGASLEFAMIRFGSIMVGVLSSFIVNLVFMPPKYENRLYHSIEENTGETIKWIRLSTRQAADHTTMKDEINHLKENVIKMNNLFLLYKEERNYFKKQQYAKTRKIVMFRQMLNSATKALDILKRLHRHENLFNHLPAELQIKLKEELDCLLEYHEQLLLKFIGKVKITTDSELNTAVCFHKEELVELFMSHYKQTDLIEQEDWMESFPIISAVVEYSDKLDHLNKLIDSYQQFHQQDEIEVSEKPLQ